MATPFQPFETKDAAAAYERGSVVRSALIQAATNRMMEAAMLRPGNRVLDIGTGPGVTAIQAAERVRPGGRVLAIDASPAMIEQAEARVRQAGAPDVEVRLMDGANLELEAASLDAVIGRNAMQFLPGWPAPLEGFRRVLKPGGRLAFMVWGSVERNRFFDLPAAVAQQGGFLRFPAAHLTVPFALADNPLDRELESAGFRDAALESVPGDVKVSDREPLLSYLRGAPGYRGILAELSEQEAAAYDNAVVGALEQFREGGAYEVKTLSLIVSGTR